MTRREYSELSYVALRREPVKNTSELYKRLAAQGYLSLTKDGYVLTLAGKQELERGKK